MRTYFSGSGHEYASFLKCIKELRPGLKAVDAQEVFNFLSFGAFYTERTLLRPVRKRHTHQPFLLHPARGFVKENSPAKISLNPALAKNPEDAFIRFFEQRAGQLSDRRYRISIDLTGGFDSRLVACMLKHCGISFDAVFSKRPGDEAEEQIVRQVADTLGCGLNILTPPPVADADELDELFRLSDGMTDLLRTHSMRNLHLWRREKGYNLVISGISGEVVKDFFWLQDFPFYRKKRPDYERLYRMRMFATQIPEAWAGAHHKTAVAQSKPKLMALMKTQQCPTNTHTYDAIYTNIKTRELASVLLHNAGGLMQVYAPFLEPEILNLGYNMPRRLRAFNRFHRRIMTRLNPALAAVPTTDSGSTASARPLLMAGDMAKNGWGKGRRLYQKLRQSQPAPAAAVAEAGNPLVETAVEESLARLRETGLFSDKAPRTAAELLPQLRGRVLTLGKLLKKLQ
ncbi:MAG: hypothetical protein ACOC2C_04480 [Cyclonatronaceae bacterium]